MMSATAFRISSQHWSTSSLGHRASEIVSRKALQVSNSAYGAMVTTGLRRGLSSPASTAWNRHVHKPVRTREEIWKRNFSRLYARRMMELAALAAARQSFLTEMEQVIDMPEQWKNWQYRDWTEDLMESLGSSKWQRFWTSTQRILSLSVLAAPGIVLLPLSYVSTSCRDISWNYALWGIERAGPTFIKLVQWATTRADLFSPEFCLHFGKLRDETRGHTLAETQKILENELGKDHASRINMHPDPIGSGCIAQVYRGTLEEAAGKYPRGTEIAVKVQHPGIWHKVCVDFYILGKLARFLEGIPKLNLKYLSLADTVRQFRDIMLPQLDLTLEAKHLQHFNHDFSSDDGVSFPRPINELTSSRVLVETFVRGIPIMEYTKASEEIKKQLAQIGLETTMKMIFLNDFVHGDLHPGNILVSMRPNGKPQLHFLDCGLVVEVGPHQHVNMIKILGAFARKNGRLAGQLMVDTSNDSQASEWDVETFVSGIERITKMDDEQNFIENVGDYIADICYMACKHRVKLEPTFINAALAVEIMEGIAAQLYPTMHVQPIALPLIVKAEVMHNLPRFWN